MITIGVLDIQGAVIEHIRAIEKLPNTKALKVKTLEDLDKIDGIILPGGESTAMGKLLNEFNLMEPLRKKIKEGFPVWGTCAGMILLAKKISNDNRVHLATMDIEVKRNGYGSQLDSFITSMVIDKVSKEPIPLVFIRAPYVEKVEGNVEVLAQVDGKIVACRERNMLVTAFHPELTDNISFHNYFLNIIKNNKKI